MFLGDQADARNCSKSNWETGSTTSGINAALAAGGQISGTVTDASTSSPVAGVFVQAYDSGGNPVGYSQTASDGTYTLSGLATGSYKVGFVPSGNYVPQFYNGKATLATECVCVPLSDPCTVTTNGAARATTCALGRLAAGTLRL
jgi:Carboxypeptidase regulatory-like domain